MGNAMEEFRRASRSHTIGSGVQTDAMGEYDRLVWEGVTDAEALGITPEQEAEWSRLSAVVEEDAHTLRLAEEKLRDAETSIDRVRDVVAGSFAERVTGARVDLVEAMSAARQQCQLRALGGEPSNGGRPDASWRR